MANKNHSERVRLELSFEGGCGLAITVSADVEDKLAAAVGDSDTTSLSFEAEDGSYTMATKKIVFVKRHARESRVGFGS